MAGRIKKTGRRRRRSKMARKIVGTEIRPRASVSRSLRHLYVQLVDDLEGKVLVSASTVQKEFRERLAKESQEGFSGGNVKAAGVLGKILAERAREKGINEIVFDRRNYRYHGRVKALAESCRQAGLKF